MADASPPIVVLVRDLMFSSKISAEARAHGVDVIIIRDPAKLTRQSGGQLIVDLNLDGAMDAAAAWKQATGGHVIGFVSHVDSPTIAKARELGIDRIMPRSQFTSQLPNVLRPA